MNNIYKNVCRNVSQINKKIEDKKSYLDYITLSPPNPDFLFKESAKNKQYKNLFTDTFIDRGVSDSPVISSRYEVNCIDDKIIFYNVRTNIACFTSDNLNTFINLKDFYFISKYGNKIYFMEFNNPKSIFTTNNITNISNVYTCNATNQLIFNYSNNSNGDLFVQFRVKKDRGPIYFDTTIYYISNNKEFKIDLEGAAHPQNFYVSYYNGLTYLFCSLGAYTSSDNINFKLIARFNESDYDLRFGKYFLTDGTNIVLRNDSSSNKVYVLGTRDFNNYSTLLSIDGIENGQYKVYVIDDIIYLCSPSGIRYSTDKGANWDIYEIKNSFSVDKYKNNLFVGAPDGIYLVSV